MIPLVKPFIPPKEVLMKKVEEIIYSGYISEGENVYEFEQKMSMIFKNKYCLAVNSGTSALHLALLLIGIKEGDEVISTALTAEPTNVVISICGADVVFADVDINTGLISPESIISRISEKTKAIMIVHYAGMVCDMEKINEISLKYNIPVVEDAAHALFSKYNNNYIGNNSDYTCFSFQAIKHITTGDGGLLCLKNEDEYNRAKKLRWFGLSKTISRLENNIIEPGYKYNMNNIDACIGLVQLNYLHDNVFKYIENGKFYDNALKNVDGVELIKYYNNTEQSYWLYTMKVQDRVGFVKMLNSNNIAASQLHLRNDRHTLFNKKKYDLKNLNEFYDSFIHIPCGWWVNESIREEIVGLIKKGW